MCVDLFTFYKYMKTMQFLDASLQTIAITMLEYKDCYKGAIGNQDDEEPHSLSKTSREMGLKRSNFLIMASTVKAFIWGSNLKILVC